MNTSKKFRNSKRVMKSTCAAVLAIAGLTVSSSAQTVVLDPDEAYYGEDLGRPIENLFSGMTTYTEPQGGLEFSLSGSHEREDDARNSSIMARVEYGVTDALQAHVQFPFDIADRSSGMEAQTGASRIEAGAKWNLIEDNSPVAMSIGGDVEIPLSANHDVSDKAPNAGPLYKPSLMIGGGGGSVEVHSSVQAELGAEDNALNYSVGSIINTSSKFTPSLELSSRAQENASPQFYATPGVTYSFNDRAELGIGAGIGLNEASDDVRLMARFSFNMR